MGKHSANSRSPFGRKHAHLGHGAGSRKRALRQLGGEPASQSRARVGDARSRRTGPLEAAPARLKAERDRRRRRYRKIAGFAFATITVLLILGAVGAYAYVRRLESTMVVEKTKSWDVELADVKPQKPYNILLLGADKRPKETIYRTDTIILARVDPRSKKVWMMSIPRDTRVEIEGHGAEKINQAFALGGAEGAVEAVSELTNLPIHHYMQVDFKGFSKAVDALGGVWVDVPVEIDDYNASGHTRGHTAQHIDAGYQLLDGAHALTFVRARHQFIDQDFSRMKNQQLFFRALADQVARSENMTRLPRVVSSVAPYIKTDMRLMEMLRTAQALKGAGSKNVYTTTLPGDWQDPYVYINEEKATELIVKMKAGRSFTDTETATEKPASSGSAAVDPSDVTLTIRNGGGVAGCAKQASSILKARGYDVREVGNANQFVYDKTLVVYKTEEQRARLVSQALPPGTKIVESRGMYSFTTDVLVVIGKDWDLAKIPVTPVKTN